MTYRIALVTLAAVIRAPVRGRFAAVTRPDSPRRPSQPSYPYNMWSLARRSALARQITGTEVRHG